MEAKILWTTTIKLLPTKQVTINQVNKDIQETKPNLVIKFMQR